MAKHRFKRFLHSSKESNFDLEEYFDNNELLYVGYEEELVYEYDDEAKTCKLIGAGGKFLSDEVITPDELVEIRGDE